MVSSINVPAIVIANCLAVALLICLFLGNKNIFHEQSLRNKYLILLVIVTIISSVLDCISAVIDGYSKYGVLISNTFLFYSAPITSVCWIILVADYMKIRISKLHKILIFVFFSITVSLITINIFYPILFRVNEYEIYERIDGLFTIYSVSYFLLMFDVIFLYLLKKYQSGGIKMFPIWSYVIPISIGIVIQLSFYGVSTISPFMAVAITSMTISFQNGLLFRDQLTNLYNRYYLSLLEKSIKMRPPRIYSVILLDINEFKHINDTQGHNAGDAAIIDFSEILIKSVDKYGEVIRYAGDEFVIVLNSSNADDVENIISSIKNSLKEFKSADPYYYVLSASFGWARYNALESSLNDTITEADKKMYIEKEIYYKARKS